MRKIKILTVATIVAMGMSCEKNDSGEINEELSAIKAQASSPQITSIPNPNIDTSHEIVLMSAEFITTGENGQMGRTIFFGEFDKGNKQLSSDFVPADPRLGGLDNIFYAVDEAEGAATNGSGGLTNAETEAAIDRAMATWDGVKCSNLGMTKIDGQADFGQVQDFFTDPGFPGFGLVPLPIVLHAGFLPGSFFDLLDENGSQFILGVTFTLVFTDSDIDNNGKADVAIKEIYYNDNFNWNDGATFDVETVALHEAGHALSQAHFGSAFVTESNGKVHFAPRAVMNAAYSGVQTEILKTDKAGHCSNWAQWPNN